METHPTKVFCIRCNSLQCQDMKPQDVFKAGFKIIDGVQYHAGQCSTQAQEVAATKEEA